MSDDLCEELIIEIFTRLPPKPLLRFRSVSKSLRSIIDSPDFICKHTSRSPQRLIITHVVRNKYVFTEEYGGAGVFCTLHGEDQLPLCPTRGYTDITTIKFPSINALIAGSCNGILLLHKFRGIYSPKSDKLTLWNPSIMRQLKLPDCPRRTFIDSLGLGLGFDPITDDYKIVSIPIYGNGNGNGESSFVSATKTCAWHPIASPMPLYSKVLSKSCYLDGVLHWVVKHLTECYIMTLDLSTHVFDRIDLPKIVTETYNLATIQGSVGVICVDSDYTWILVRRDGSWSVVLKFEKTKVEAGATKFLELANSGDLVLDAFFQGVHVYTPKTGARSTLVKFNPASSILFVDTYVESLRLLHMGKACEVNHLFLQDKKATPLI